MFYAKYRKIKFTKIGFLRRLPMKRVSCTNQYFFLLTEKGRPVSRGVQEVRSHPPPPPKKKNRKGPHFDTQ